jgi:hypothetical protein
VCTALQYRCPVCGKDDDEDRRSPHSVTSLCNAIDHTADRQAVSRTFHPRFDPENDDDEEEEGGYAQIFGPILPHEKEIDEDAPIKAQARPSYPDQDSDEEDSAPLQTVTPHLPGGGCESQLRVTVPRMIPGRRILPEQRGGVSCFALPIFSQDGPLSDNGDQSTSVLWRLERRMSLSPLSPSCVDPAFIAADMVAPERDEESLEDWPTLVNDSELQEDEEDGDTSLGIVAAAADRGLHRGMVEQRGGAFVLPLPGDSGGSDTGGWPPQPSQDDDGDSPLPMYLPSSYPGKPRSGGAAVVLVAREQQQLQEATRC